jgi:hypothetical protein
MRILHTQTTHHELNKDLLHINSTSNYYKKVIEFFHT